jgi:pimeloyl-ACP methyl ester carboxylesterase
MRIHQISKLRVVRSGALAAAASLVISCGAQHDRPQEPLPVRFAGLSGVLYGSGLDGVVLANQSDRGREAWTAFARYLAGGGLRVLAFDYGDRLPEDEVAAAARELHRRGVRHIVLVGASKGAKASVVAGVEPPPGVVAVVALSAERYAQRRDVLPWARRLRLSALFVTAREDPLSAEDTPLLERAAPSAAKRLLIVPGAAHGVKLSASAAVRKAVLRFVRAQVHDPPAPQALAARCGQPVGAPSRTFWFRADDGVRLDGAEIGSGSRVIVLAHEYPSDLCPWLDYASKLARAGFRAWLFDFRGFGRSQDAPTPAAAWRLQDDVAGAVAEARRRGARHVVLVGGSLGGAAVVAAAPTIRPPVDGVVSLSGEIRIDEIVGSHGLDPLPIANRIHVPLLLVVSRHDRLISPAEMRRLARLVRGPVRVFVLPVDAHGWNLLDPALVRTLDRFYRAAFP